MKLLLSPYKLAEDFLLLEAVEMMKTNKGPQLLSHEPSAHFLRKEFPSMPKEARDALSFFSKAELLSTKAQIDKNAKATGGDYTYRRQTLLRKAYDELLNLKPYLGLCQWMHRIKLDAGRFQTGPCSFSSFRPILSFEVTKEGDLFSLICYVELNAGKYLLSDFTRNEFLLQSKNEYFLLTWRDYQLLEWLTQQQLPASAETFQQNILGRIQSDYSVDTGKLIQAERIEVKPRFQVLLSEISNNFLVLTPQWNYDGFIAEGPFTNEFEITRAGHSYVVVRDNNEESPLRDFLLGLHPNFQKQLNGYYYLSFADAQKKQWFAKTYHQLLDREIDVVGMDMLSHFRYSSEKIQTKMEILEQLDSHLVIGMEVSFGKERVPLNELQKMLWAGQKAVLLKDGSLGLITDEWLDQYGQLMKHGKPDKNTIRVGSWIALNGEIDSSQKVVQKEWWAKWNRWRTEEHVALFPLPDSVQVESLRPYQQKGYEWLRLLSAANAGGCLADDMGLGKTLQTICYLASRLEENPLTTHLVVCPSSLLYNWHQELKRFAPSLRIKVYHGPQRDRAELKNPEGHILITSYGTLRSDVEEIKQVVFDSIIADESHNVKNPSSLTARALYELTARSRFALSGTPIMNNTFDLYGQFSFMLPGMFGSREFFKREYADPIDRYAEPEKIKALQKLTAPFILRRTKEQVATDLPEKIESILWCEMGTEQRLAYESIRDQLKSNLFIQIKEQGLEAGKLSVLHGILKLRMACNSSELIKDEALFNYDSVKTQVLMDELQNLPAGSKALVFSQFTSMLDLLEKEFVANNMSFFRLDGSTKVDERQERVNAFNSDETDARVFLLSLKAGNAGLNLTSADYVFLFDPWWNRAVEQQAIDRTHRIGQTRSVFAYRMLCRDSIEERILQLQQRKSKVSEELIGAEDAGFIQRLTEDELAFLFS